MNFIPEDNQFQEFTNANNNNTNNNNNYNNGNEFNFIDNCPHGNTEYSFYQSSSSSDTLYSDEPEQFCFNNNNNQNLNTKPTTSANYHQNPHFYQSQPQPQHQFIQQIPYNQASREVAKVGDDGLQRVNNRLNQLKSFLDKATIFCSFITKNLDQVEQDMELALTKKKVKTQAQPQPNFYPQQQAKMSFNPNQMVNMMMSNNNGIKHSSHQPSMAPQKVKLSQQAPDAFLQQSVDLSTEYPSSKSNSAEDEVDISKAFNNKTRRNNTMMNLSEPTTTSTSAPQNHYDFSNTSSALMKDGFQMPPMINNNN